MKTVFISRNLTAESIFVKTLEPFPVKIIGASLLDFSLIPFEAIPVADWYFFYSQNGVKFFFEGCQQFEVYPDLSAIRFAAIGESTAKALSNRGFYVDFVGTGEPFSTATAFLEIIADGTVLFIEAKKSRQSVQKILTNKIKYHNLVVYRNEQQDFNYFMANTDLLIFTSPLNAEAYLKRHYIQPHQKVVAIGESTAATLRRLGWFEIIVSKQPNEQSLANAVIDLLQK